MKNQRKFGKAIFAAAAVIALAGAFAGTARADDDDDGWRHGHAYGHERQEWREHEWREQQWRAHERWEWRRDDDGYWHHVRFVEYTPYYVVEPPPVFYQPAPVFYSPPPSGFNVVIPLTIK